MHDRNLAQVIKATYVKRFPAVSSLIKQQKWIFSPAISHNDSKNWCSKKRPMKYLKITVKVLSYTIKN